MYVNLRKPSAPFYVFLRFGEYSEVLHPPVEPFVEDPAVPRQGLSLILAEFCVFSLNLYVFFIWP